MRNRKDQQHRPRPNFIYMCVIYVFQYLANTLQRRRIYLYSLSHSSMFTQLGFVAKNTDMTESPSRQSPGLVKENRQCKTVRETGECQQRCAEKSGKGHCRFTLVLMKYSHSTCNTFSFFLNQKSC